MGLPSHTVENGSVLVDSGQSRLRELGYKQELKRDLSVFSNFAFSFSIISVLTGITTLYNTGLTFGGPISLVYGWFIAGGFTMFVGLSMAEICSSYPTSGGLYYWSARLAGRNWAPFASWLTGWFNIVGQWAVTTSVDFSLAQLIQVIILLSTGGKNGGGYEASKYVVIAFHGAILSMHAIINSLPISVLSFFGQLAAVWNLLGMKISGLNMNSGLSNPPFLTYSSLHLGVVLLMILIPSVATERASAKFVFTHFNTDNGEGINSKVYIFVLGLLMSQYTLTGYDASAHMTEETKNADKNGPKGIISAIGISIIFGWGYLLGITFAVTDIPYLLSEDNDAGGYAIAEIFYLAFKNRYGSGVGGIICLGVIGIAIFFCGMSSVTSNSRMVYAFSRDGAMPLSSLWHKVNKQEVPINAVWLSAFISFCMALTSLGSLVAFQAMVSIATIGLYIAYALPIFFRVSLARKSFVPGPFNLGRYGVVVGWIAVLWVATISVLFSLPVAYPVTSETLNYTPVAVGGLLVITVSWWIVSARHWFTGPITNI
ncbi:putative amino-acid permease C15C4.04c [Gossypium arboreum]|uniref:Putative amino-acid permease C15C4.04c n=1 Tax=Gossypium arboreum TaxID=29729 RepID=A0A0B0NED2_GOSAR|nr:putative amino-acid permease C15C4.04c [Gossypium arboreum]